MKMLKVFAAMVLLVPLLLGCQAKVDREVELARLLLTDREFAQASIDHGCVAAFRMYLTEDALSLPNGFDPVRGIENICADMKDMDAEHVLVWEPKGGDISRAADLGYTWGTYMMMKKEGDDQTPISYGKYLNVWKKQGDGTWKAVLDMGNKSPLPEIP